MLDHKVYIFLVILVWVECGHINGLAAVLVLAVTDGGIQSVLLIIDASPY